MTSFGSYIKKNCDEKKVTKIKDMKDFFSDKEALKNTNPEKAVYTVYVKKGRFMSFGLAVIEPGSVGKEYFMTRGHYHTKKSAEVYIHIKGRGLLLLQNRRFKKVRMEKGNTYFVPPGYAHRVVNTGKNRLEFISVYSPESGHDYGKIRKKGFRRRIFRP